MKRALISLLALAGAGLAGCETDSVTGPAVQSTPVAGPSEAFSEQDFAWSTRAGGASVDGVMTYQGGPSRFTCQDVKLIPRTPWSRRRMIILYGSDNQAEVPADQVRARTAEAPSGTYAQYVRSATCDSANHFNFSGLPDGGWFVITLASPVGGGDKVAVMHRVDTHGGVRRVTLN
jgi:predicted small secreted protein